MFAVPAANMTDLFCQGV